MNSGTMLDLEALSVLQGNDYDDLYARALCNVSFYKVLF